MRFLAVLALSGCAVRTTTATPSELAAHGPVFVSTGRAELVRTRGNVVVSADERVDVRLRDGDLQRSATLTVRELVEGCTAEGADQGCLARKAVEEPVLRHRERKVDGERAAILVGVGAMGGVVGYCMAECQGDGDLERGAKYTVGFVGGMLALGFLLMMVGGHD
jgi:hypothetical protein